MDRTASTNAAAAENFTAGRPHVARAPMFADIETHLPLWCEKRLSASLDHTLRHWNGKDDIWIFAYGSLIWNPDLPLEETRRAKVYGRHRSLCLWSTVNRGTPECPGLVLALDVGGSCEGLAYRIGASSVRQEFTRLWQREMARGSYLPCWVKTHTPQGNLRALAFVMNRRQPSYAGRLDDAHVLDVFQRACGRFGTTADYVRKTVEALRGHGVYDARLERLVTLFESSLVAGS
ncbi:MAG TPA: gamma-glutamylcyclotransferase [Burkholderiaceae bacterium]|nr:gamma-glutamylcyclotransferase [Burkholderiaceae bacterium]